jgi:starch phosphorylase
VLDGWWAEAYNGENGWAIWGDMDHDAQAQDARDADTLHELLGGEVLDSFYARDENGLPTRWIERMRASLKTLGPEFCATRMLEQYLSGPYAFR